MAVISCPKSWRTWTEELELREARVPSHECRSGPANRTTENAAWKPSAGPIMGICIRAPPQCHSPSITPHLLWKVAPKWGNLPSNSLEDRDYDETASGKLIIWFINQAAFSGPASCLRAPAGRKDSQILNQRTPLNFPNVTMKFTQTCLQYQMGSDFSWHTDQGRLAEEQTQWEI